MLWTHTIHAPNTDDPRSEHMYTIHTLNSHNPYSEHVYRYQNGYESGHIIYHSKALGMYHHSLGGNVALLNAAQRYANK